MSTMALEKVRDWHRGCQQAAAADGRIRAAECHEELADAIDAAIRARGEPFAWYCEFNDPEKAIPLYAEPPAPKVTDAMCQSLRMKLPLRCADISIEQARIALEAALKDQS